MNPGSEAFHAVLSEIAELHDRKQADYGKDDDPFANIRACEEWGIPPWVGAFIRVNDKVHRLKRFAEKGVLANESAEDSMLDIAVYALIALCLYREQSEAEAPELSRDYDPADYVVTEAGMCRRCNTRTTLVGEGVRRCEKRLDHDGPHMVDLHAAMPSEWQ